MGETLDLALLREEAERANRQASAYIGLAVLNRDDSMADAAYMRRGLTMDRIAELIAEEIARAAPHEGHGSPGGGNG